ncbi:MAG TPA: T9SS type A sorting domain-containing protein, partial [Bacteroidales bacterium]|nr:T9SS type A sorting domain-containing protein [Bacteroidales bacterium]
VVLNGNENVSVKVASITGQVVYNHNYGTLTSGLNTLTIDGSNLTTGVYFCTVTVGDKQTTNKLVVK